MVVCYFYYKQTNINNKSRQITTYNLQPTLLCIIGNRYYFYYVHSTWLYRPKVNTVFDCIAKIMFWHL